jgi:transposase InsO family protein
VSDLVICNWYLLRWCILLLNHGRSEVGHRFVLVATNYFTNWTEAVPLKNMTHREVIEFIIELIIHRFGIPQTLTTNQGTSFISKEVREFTKSYKIKLLNSSPYYAQTNGQAESSNKVLIKLIKKKRYKRTLGGGIKLYTRLYGLIVYLDIVLLKLLLLSLCMVKRPFYMLR